MEASVDHDSRGATLSLVADDGGEVLRMEISIFSYDEEIFMRGKAALEYLLGELGMQTWDWAKEFVDATLHRWAWDKVSSLACEPILARTKQDSRFVYVISALDSSEPLTKIGVAGSPEKRLQTISTSSPHALRIEFTRYSSSASAVEKAAHLYFSEHRRNGEWFSITPDQAIDYIIDATREAA